MSTLWQSHSITVLLSSPGITDLDMLTYDPALSRIRVDEALAAEVPPAEPLNLNPGAEVDTAGWLAFGGTLQRSTAQAHEGVASVEFTPTGGGTGTAVNANTFEAGVAGGTAITNANSGGAAGRAFDQFGGAPTFDATHVRGGTLAMKCDMAAGDSWVEWLDGAPQAEAETFIRFYLWLDALPSGNVNAAIVVTTTNAFKGRLRILPSGLLEWQDNTFAQMCITTIPVATGQWVRVEGRLTSSATTAEAEIRLYNDAESGTATETVASAATFNTLADGIAGWRFGADIGGGVPDVLWMDDVAADPTDWIGSATVAGSGGVVELSAPDGSAAESDERTVSAWVYIPTGYSQVRARIQWIDSGGAFLSSENGPTVDVPAATWTFLTVTGTAPALTARVAPVVDLLGAVPASAITYVDELTATAGGGSAGPVPAGATRVIERSTDLVNWVTVRGGAEQLVDAGANPLNDFEFVANAENHYRIRVLVEGALYWTFRDSISVVLDAMWLKPVRRPFLSRVVTMTEHGDVERSGRSGVFPIAGRGLPVAVVDLHTSQSWTLELMTIGQPAAAELDLIASSGDVFLLQGPPECPITEGHYVIGDLNRSRRSTRGARRYFALPLTQVAAPSAELEGVTFTWRSAMNRWATWADVAAEGLTWAQIDDLIGTAEDVVVG